MSKMSKKENDEARAKAYKTLSANETPVVVCAADVPEATLGEERIHECGYRRGYMQGYMQALNNIWENATLSGHRINIRISLKSYQDMERFGNAKLREWRVDGVRGTDESGTWLPPAYSKAWDVVNSSRRGRKKVEKPF